MLYTMDSLANASAEVKEALMGLRVGDTAAPCLIKLQRVQLLGKCTNVNTTTWTISAIRTHTIPRNTTLSVRPLQHTGVADSRPPYPSRA
jgi:hypothetical protein